MFSEGILADMSSWG